MFYKNEIKAFERPKLFHVLPRRPKKIEIIVRARPGLQTTAVSPFILHKEHAPAFEAAGKKQRPICGVRGNESPTHAASGRPKVNGEQVAFGNRKHPE